MVTIRSKRGPKAKATSGAAAQLIAAGASPEQIARVGKCSVRTARRRLKEAHGTKRLTPQRAPVATTHERTAARTRDKLVDALERAETDVAVAAALDDLHAVDHADYRRFRARRVSIFDAALSSEGGEVLLLLRAPSDVAELVAAVTADPRLGHLPDDGDVWPSQGEMRAAAHARAVALAEEVLAILKSGAA